MELKLQKLITELVSGGNKIIKNYFKINFTNKDNEEINMSVIITDDLDELMLLFLNTQMVADNYEMTLAQINKYANDDKFVADMLINIFNTSLNKILLMIKEKLDLYKENKNGNN